MKILKVKCLAPTRLDNYLMQQFPALNPGRLNKALRENKIKLNGKKQPLSTRVMAGDEIKLFILDDVLDADKRVDGPAWKNARGPAQVVYDCPQILIVNKPAGLAVDGPDDDTLLNRALLYLNQQGEYKENDVYTPALCHRLDTGTSGLVIIAKTPEAEELFLAAIKSREVKKTYLCVTFGRPTPPDATLGGYLLKDADRGIVKIVEDKQPGAKDVETRYETIAVSGRLALLKVQHFRHIEGPIIHIMSSGLLPNCSAIFFMVFCPILATVPLHPEWEEPITFPTVSIKNSGTQSANDVASVRPFLSVTIPSTPFSFFSIFSPAAYLSSTYSILSPCTWSESISFL